MSRVASGEGAIQPGDTGVWVTCARHQEGKAAREVGVLFAEVCGFSYSLCFDPLSIYLACFDVFGVWCVVLWLWFLWCCGFCGVVVVVLLCCFSPLPILLCLL